MIPSYPPAPRSNPPPPAQKSATTPRLSARREPSRLLEGEGRVPSPSGHVATASALCPPTRPVALPHSHSHSPRTTTGRPRHVFHATRLRGSRLASAPRARPGVGPVRPTPPRPHLPFSLARAMSSICLAWSGLYPRAWLTPVRLSACMLFCLVSFVWSVARRQSGSEGTPFGYLNEYKPCKKNISK